MAFNLTLKVHPTALLQIVDSFERRNMDAYRVIGTLMGTVDKGVVEATNAFCVPHKESDQGVEMDLTYASDMFDLNQKVNKEETIIGWFATGSEITSQSSVIHDYYSRECQNPIHLTLDTTLQNSKLNVKAYISVSLGTPNGKLGCMFTPIQVDVICYEPETVAFRSLNKTVDLKDKSVKPADDLEQVVEAVDKLKVLISNTLNYVEDVIKEKIPQDNEVGRALLNMVYSIPKMNKEEFESMFNSNVKDLLMVLSLAQLVQTQLQLNEKLTFLTTL